MECVVLSGMIVWAIIASLAWSFYARESEKQEKRSDNLLEENYQIRTTLSLYERDECKNAHIEEDCLRCGAK